MHKIIHERAGITVIEITSEETIVNDVHDIIDLMSETSTRKFIFKKENFHPNFFDLKTGVAGDILQKASTY